MTSLKQAIIATLTYSDHFDHPLTASELHSRLISHKTSLSTLARSLNSLVKSGKIVKSSDYYHLPGRKSLIKLRRRRSSIARTKAKLADHLISRISSVPGILAIYLTGSLAVGSSKKGDDIDLMIITQSGQLWTTRLLLTLYTQFLGLRRLPNAKQADNKLCLNLYLTPDSLTIPPSIRSLYTAYELTQAVPVYDPYHTHPHLLHSNPWISSYLPNFPTPKSPPLSLKTDHCQLITGFIESLAYQFQLRYMKSRITREIITPDSAFFHPHNPGKKVLDKLNL